MNKVWVWKRIQWGIYFIRTLLFYCCILFYFIIGVQLLYNVVLALVSAAQQWSSYMCTSVPSLWSLPPALYPAPLGHPRAQGWASCATEQLPALYFTSILHRKVKVIQLCPTLCDHRNYTVHGILQARILEWIVFPFSRGSSQPRNWTQVSRISGGLFTSWAIVEAQEHWSG